MSKECTLEISDEVNVRFKGLDVVTRRKLKEKLEYFLPYARHTPAFKLGRWNGKTSYCDTGGRTYLNLLDDLLPVVTSAGYHIDVFDLRTSYDFKFDEVNENSLAHLKWPAGHVHEDESIVLREHQVKVINAYLKNPQSIQEVSTGAGKTLITAILAIAAGEYGRTLVIVPNKDLVTQTERDYKLLGLDVGVYFGDRKEPGRQHTIVTWQSIEALDRKSKYYDAELDVSIFNHDLAAVIVDEAHGTKAEVLQKHLKTTFANVPLRWGMTGTIPLEEFECKALIACIGPIIQSVTAKELQDKGVLSKLHISIIQVKDMYTHFDSYQSELKYLVTDEERLKFLANYIKPQLADGNSLILVDRIQTGDLLMEMIPDAVFVSGKVKSKDRKEEYDSLKELNNKPIIATYGVAAVGLDIPRIFNLFMIEPGKSYIRVIQSIGRGIRKAKDKDFVNVYDLTSTAKYSRRHLTERKKFYKKAEYPFKITKVDR